MQKDISKQVYEYDYILEESFLSIYNRNSNKLKSGYDALLQVGDAKIFILHEVATLCSITDNIPKSDLYEYSKLTVNTLMHRHLKIQKNFEEGLKKNDKPTKKDKLFFVGLASLIVNYNGQSFNIDHQFGSNYFQEHLVLDFDGDDNLLQLFGTKSFLTILKILSTPVDTISYLSYHRHILVEQETYRLETILAHTFLNSKALFNPAINVEKELIKINVLDKHDSRLIKAINSEDSQQKSILINRMKEFSDLWMRLLKSTTTRQISKEQPLSRNCTEQLLSESLYTRMKIIEDVFAYGRMNKRQQAEGYITYQHSYSKFGRQYMLVMYGSDSDSWLSREAIKEEYLNLLINLNSQLQNPVMEDLFLLGFDMLNMKTNGEVDIQMDVYHLKANKMTDIEHHLHRQLLALKAKVQRQPTTQQLATKQEDTTTTQSA